MRKYLVFLISVVLLTLGSLSVGSQGSGIFSNTTIGYESFNGTMHIWNENDDYYFNETSGIQLTNHYNEYWSHNTFCGGRYTGSGWLDFCSDEIPFTWTIESDNATYVNWTGYYDIFWAGKDLRFILSYILKTNDTKLTMMTTGINTGNKDIPENLRFIWKVDDIRVNMIEGNNSYYIDNYRYNASGYADYTWDNNMTNPAWLARLDKTQEYMEISWNQDSNYTFTIQNETGQYNAPVTLTTYINGGILSGESYSTNFTWIDALDTKNECNELLTNPATCLYTVGAGADLLVVGVTTKGGPRSSGDITFNNDALTDVAGDITSGGEGYTEIWYMSDPPTGTQYTVSVPNTGTDEVNIIVSSYTLGAENAVVENYNTLASQSGANPSITVTYSSTSNAIVDMLFSGYRNVVGGNSGGTILYQRDTGNENYAAQQNTDQTSPTTFSYTQSADDWANIIVAFTGNDYPYYSGAEPANNSNLAAGTTSIILNMTATDPDSDTTEMIFYNAADDSVICDNESITSGTEVGCLWSGLTDGDYSWYVAINDSYWTNTSGDYKFSIPILYGQLSVNITLPVNNSAYDQYQNFSINATVSCVGAAGAKCGTVSAYARYNNSEATPLTSINTTDGDLTMYILSGGSASSTLAYWRPVDYTQIGTGSTTEAIFDKRYNDTTTSRTYGDNSNADCGMGVYVEYNLSTQDTGTLTYTIQLSDSGVEAYSPYIQIYNFTANQYYTLETWTDNTIGIEYSSYNFVSDNVDNGNLSIKMCGPTWDGTPPTPPSFQFYDTHITTSGNTYDTWALEGKVNTSALVQSTIASDDSSPYYGSGSSGQNLNINQSDDVDQSAGSSSDYSIAWYHFAPDEALSDIQSIDFYYEVSSAINGGGDTTYNVYLWNTTGTEWVLFSTMYGEADAVYNLQINDTDIISDLYDAVNGHSFHMLFEAPITGTRISTDYMRLNVISSGSGASNPQTSSETLEQGEDWNVTWVVNATGAQGSSWWIDVNFTSSYGHANIPDNHTGDIKITINTGAANNIPYYTSIEPTNNTEFAAYTTLATLNVTYNDGDAEQGTVTFYNASDDNAICTNTSVDDGTKVSCLWSVSSSDDHQWYVILDDSSDTNTSGDYNFSIANAVPYYSSIEPGNNTQLTNNTATSILTFVNAKTGGDCGNFDAIDDTTQGTDGSDYCEFNHDYDASGETTGEFKWGGANPPDLSGYTNIDFDIYLSGNPTGAPYIFFYCSGGFSTRMTYELTGMSSGVNTWSIPQADFTTVGDCDWTKIVDILIWSANADLADDTVVRLYSINATITGVNVVLNATVTDGDSDTLEVSFMNASNDEIICTNTSIASGTEVGCLWMGLASADDHQWYVNVSDSIDVNTSGDYNFSFVNPAADTCSPATPLTADYTYDCADNCVISSALDAAGYNLAFTGTGTVSITADIINCADVLIRGTDSSNICTVTVTGANFCSS